MSRSSPRALFTIICLLCLPAFAQEVSVVRIGVTTPGGGTKGVSSVELRSQLVKALNQHKVDKKLKAQVQAVALDASPGGKAIAEAREKNCQFVLYSQVRQLQDANKFEPQNGTPGGFQAVQVATVDYQLRRAVDGASMSIGIAESEGMVIEREAVMQAIELISGKVMADLRNGNREPVVEPIAAGAESSSPAPGEVSSSSSSFCGWLPGNIAHADALRGVCEYAITLPREMPNFICQQETSRYEGHNRVPIDLITATIRYEDGNESYSDVRVNGRPSPGAVGKAAGLWSSGQFEANLRAIFHVSNHPAFGFSGENRVGKHPAWVFAYHIARQTEPLWELQGEGQVAAPPYDGELWVDQKTGAVLRFRSTAKNLPTGFPMQSAEVVTDYDEVVFGDGTAFVLPADSTIAIKNEGTEPTRNLVQFRACHKFRAKARMVLNVAGDAGNKSSDEAATAESRKSEWEQNETIYAILREQAIREDAERLASEQAQELEYATIGAIWKMGALEKQRQHIAEQQSRELQNAGQPRANKTMPASDTPAETIFKVSVKLVPVSVVVRDTKGHAIGNLGKKDFLLFDERKPQPISSFLVETAERELAPSERAHPAPGAAPATSASPATAAENENDVAFVFDDLQTTFEDLANVITAAERHLSALRPEDRAAVFTTSGQVGLDFTRDREKLQSVLRMLKPHSRVTSDCPSITYYMADLIANRGDAGISALAVDETMRCAGVNKRAAESMAKAKALEVVNMGRLESEQTLQVLSDVITRAAAMPGRRSIVLISAGFLTAAPDAQDKEMSLVDQAVRAGIVFNTLDVQGTGPTGISASNSEDLEGRGALDREEGSARSEVLADLAYGTGGIFFHNNNDLREGFRQTGDIPEYIYLLGFSPQKLDGKFHKLKVKVTGTEKVSVQARVGYYALKPVSAQ
ncbi:MAG TPA: VWA domain-containing protein [Candidatus Binatus sp.]|jgi:VWFA-related protein|nr:VWA domain-containing protein [Candidatus Binatus sp.]